MFSASERVLYGKRQLIEVICQLRFPTILSISAKEPAEFQEAIRAEFPRYARNLEKLPPKVIGQPGAMKLEEQPTVVNYQFLRRLEGQPDKHLPCAGHAGLYDVGGFCPEARRGAGTVRRHLSPGVF